MSYLTRTGSSTTSCRGFAQQGAKARIKGIEVEAMGKMTENIRLIGTYTNLDAIYEKHFNAFEVGTRVEGVPEHMASLWAVYTFNYGPLQGLSLGGGMRYIGESTDHGKLVTGNLGEVTTPAFTLSTPWSPARPRTGAGSSQSPISRTNST